MHRRRAIALLVVAASVASTTACPSATDTGRPPTALAAELPEGPPSISGTITALADGRARIEERPADDAGSEKAVVQLAGARILRRSGGAATAGDLAVGQRVSAWFTGPVARSYPVQAVAAAVVIEGDAR